VEIKRQAIYSNAYQQEKREEKHKCKANNQPKGQPLKKKVPANKTTW
jgi:hypothetical protein